MRKMKVLAMALTVATAISVLSGVASARPLDDSNSKYATQTAHVIRNVIQRMAEYYWVTGPFGHHMSLNHW